MNPEFVRLLESLANGVVIADAAGTIVFANHFLERIERLLRMDPREQTECDAGCQRQSRHNGPPRAMKIHEKGGYSIVKR